MKIQRWTYRCFLMHLIILALCVAAFLTGCGGRAEKKPSKGGQLETETDEKYWLIQVSDTKKFTYAIPSGKDGAIDMTATLYFTAWKQGGVEMYGQYEGRAMVTLDMDLSKVGDGRVTVMGGVMDDSICDNITFEILPSDQNAVKAEGEDIDLAPLAEFVGQAEILTDEYMISQQRWKALADGEIKLDINSSFGNGERVSQGFTLKAGKEAVLVSHGDLAAAYGLDAFKGTIKKTNSQTDALSWFRDKVMTRMEERLASAEQSADQQLPETGFDDTVAENVFTVDSEGREGMDTDGDGILEVYYGEDGEVWADFDGDGKYEIAGSDGSDME